LFRALLFNGFPIGHFTQKQHKPLQRFAIPAMNQYLFGVVSPEFEKLLVWDPNGVVVAILSFVTSMEPSEIDPSLDRLRTASDQFGQLVLCQALADARARFAQAPEPLPNGRHRAMEPFCDEADVLAAGEI
jgi:hypothetical protein